MSEVAEFLPEIMTMVFVFKAGQLLVIFGAQVAIMVVVDHYNSTFGIIAILNIAFFAAYTFYAWLRCDS